MITVYRAFQFLEQTKIILQNIVFPFVLLFFCIYSSEKWQNDKTHEIELSKIDYDVVAKIMRENKCQKNRLRRRAECVLIVFVKIFKINGIQSHPHSYTLNENYRTILSTSLDHKNTQF